MICKKQGAFVISQSCKVVNEISQTSEDDFFKPEEELSLWDDDDEE